MLAAGGAGSLLLPDDSKVMNAPDFPPEYAQSAASTAKVLVTIRSVGDDLNWTFLSPSLFFADCGRTWKFLLGLDHAVFDEGGYSSISIEDYAIAMVDELEHPRHGRTRFTVGY
ncbi:hypothetical protein [Novosphingobium sp.]|uniref:NAD(P)-dependent oxidoreductase n=1 Tax=Novosphingobium sp. TaxID=1874826 RepID=UPI002608643C|nr:hypothetical protein [Novosphingobium sp.]